MDQRIIKRLGRSTAIVLLLLTLAPASAQERIFHDAAGRVTGKATTCNGVTTFRDAFGQTTGSIRRGR